MRIVSVEDGFERVFWDIVNRDLLDYYFFVYDWKNRKEQTKILLALEGDRVAGLVLLYANHVVQLRGNREAVKLLLDSVDFEKVELQAPLDCEDIVLRKYEADFRHTLVPMRLERGEENIRMKHVPLKLGMENAEEVVEVLRSADPEVWGDLDFSKRHWGDAYMLGIRVADKLVSVGLTRFVDFGSNIGAIATLENYRNRGFATSIVSALVKEILRSSPVALIHVFTDNAPAVHVYSRAGFKPYKQYLLVQGKDLRAKRAFPTGANP